MGIPKFYGSWILRKRKDAPYILTQIVPNNVFSVSFDLNSIFHSAAQEIYGYGEGRNEKRQKEIASMTDQELEEEHFALIMNKVYNIVSYVSPSTMVVLAVDGVAPLAKITQQRSRRYRSANESSDLRFDSNVITPGTDFMFRLDAYIKKWIIENRSLMPREVVYSNHMVKGEGEQKIFDVLKGYKVSGKGAHFIYGLDADLIVLSVMSDIQGIYLIREKSSAMKSYEDMVVIDGLRKYIYREMDLPSATNDFAVLTFFLGNDFIPHSPMFSGDLGGILNYLIGVYKKLKKPLTHKGEVHIPHLMELISMLAQEEKTSLIHVYQHPPKLGFYALTESVTEKIVMMPVENIYRNVQQKITYEIDMDKFTYLWNLKNFSPAKEMIGTVEKLPSEIVYKIFGASEQKINEWVQNFITAFAWTYIYYKHGTEVCNPNFLFPYNYAPMLHQVVKGYKGRIYPTRRDQVNMDYSLPVLLQLLAVLPPKSKHSLPKGLAKMMECTSPIADLFPVKVFVDTDGKDLERLGTVQISFVEPIRLFSIEDQIEMTDEELEKYIEDENIVFVIEEEKIIENRLNPSEVNVTSTIVGDPKEVETFIEATVPVVLGLDRKPIPLPPLKKK
jgi:5'-3' exonuclease